MIDELLKLAAERVKLLTRCLSVNYQPDADLLLIRFSEEKSTYSKYDDDNGVLLNYDANHNLVSVEILDLTAFSFKRSANIYSL